MIHWITPYYRPASKEKLRLLAECLDRNLRLPFISKVTLLAEDIVGKLSDTRESVVNLGRRASFSDFLQIVDREAASGRLMVLSNSDIFLSEDIARLSQRITLGTTAIALTRWEMDGSFPRVANLAWAQDTWMLRAQSLPDSLLETTQINLGIAGCENIFAAQLMAHGFQVWNPCLDIRTYHNDPNPAADYSTGKRYFGFYVHPIPCKSDAIQTTKPACEMQFHTSR